MKAVNAIIVTLAICCTGIGTIAASIAYVPTAQAECTKMCNPDVSKPCGKGCTSKYNSCHKSWATTCSGVKAVSGSKAYSEQKHVEPDSVEATGGASKGK